MEEMSCKKCLHYEDCLKRFRNAKANGEYEFTDENEYFAYVDQCVMFITGYCKQSDTAKDIIGSIKRYTLSSDTLTEEQVSEIWKFLEKLNKNYEVKYEK